MAHIDGEIGIRHEIDTSFRLFEPIQITIARSLNGSNEVNLCYPIGAIVGNGI